MADRYATVHPDGVHLRLPLTHEEIAEIAAARRPSVSTALSRLARHGDVERRNGLWVLHGDPPSHPLENVRQPPRVPSRMTAAVRRSTG
jgi:hypothetical protein